MTQMMTQDRLNKEARLSLDELADWASVARSRVATVVAGDGKFTAAEWRRILCVTIAAVAGRRQLVETSKDALARFPDPAAGA